MDNHILAVRIVSIVSIIVGIVFSYWVEKRRYDRMVGLNQKPPPPFLKMLFIVLIEKAGSLIGWGLILFGIIFLLVLYLNYHHF